MPDSAASKGGPTASQRITAQIAELNDWRGKMLADLRTLILAADSDIAEEWKWNTAVWTRNEVGKASRLTSELVSVLPSTRCKAGRLTYYAPTAK